MSKGLVSIIIVVSIFGGLGILLLVGYFLYSQIQAQNVQNQIALQKAENAASSGGGGVLGGIIGALL